MMSYLPPSDEVKQNVLCLLRDFVPEYIMPSMVVIEPQIKEKQRGHNVLPQAYMVPKDPSLNKVRCCEVVWNVLRLFVQVNSFHMPFFNTVFDFWFAETLFVNSDAKAKHKGYLPTEVKILN